MRTINNFVVTQIATRNPMRFKFIPDKLFLKIKYYHIFHRNLDLLKPQTFNEKLQWLKLYDRKPEYTTMVDKYAVKEYIAAKIGEEYTIPTIGVWTRFNDIDFDSLPNKFVLKCTHDSGGLVICTDKSNLDTDEARKTIERSLKNNYYYSGREWPYKNIEPRIIAEQYMQDDDLNDIKISSLDGEHRLVLVCSKHFSKDVQREASFDEKQNYLEMRRPNHGNTNEKGEKNYELMERLAKVLSEKIFFSRIDFYEMKKQVYFGDVILFSDSGFEGFGLEDWDDKRGKWTKLPGGGLLKYDDISIEVRIRTKQEKALVDYKFFCFNGVADSVMVCTERETGDSKFYFFDRNWNLKRYNIRGKQAPDNFTLPKPANIEKMFQLAEMLSQGIPYVRVDLYSINKKIYFGEMTFFPDSGFDVNILPETDIYLGGKLSLVKE